MVLADLACWAGGVGIEHHRKVAHTLRSLHKHAAKLSAAHHAQGGLAAIDQSGTGKNRFHGKTSVV